MSGEISVILADSNLDYVEEIKGEMIKSGLDVAAITDDGMELLGFIREKKPQSIVMDIIMKNLDGIEVLSTLEEEGYMKGEDAPVIIINSSLDNQAVVDKAISLGAKYYFRKPTLHAEIARRIKMLCVDSRDIPKEYDLDADPARRDHQIASLIKQVGVPVHLIGYRYLLAAVKLVCDDMGAIDEITNRIYPEVARQYGTKPVRVERSIRYAIEAAFDKGYADEVERIFGYTVNSLKGKPTNSEFIAMVADNVLLI